MDKFTKLVKVPKGIRYLSEWKDFTFESFPEKCIIDKQIPGCGYTEWCISNGNDVILASPRRILLQNKYDQHPEDIYLVVNELDKDINADEDISAEVKLQKEFVIDDEAKKKLDVYQRLKVEIANYRLKRSFEQKGAKILVTYDSYYLVKKILEEQGCFDQFYTVVDEFQSVLHDSRFKSTTELGFMKVLANVEKVHFVSATPTLEKYLKMMVDFRDLPYFEIDWASLDPSRVKKPDLVVKAMKSVGDILPKIIRKYQGGDFEVKYVSGPDESIKSIVSDEVVFYVNSVKHIIAAIKKTNLRPEEVNILCSNTPENIKKINKGLNTRVLVSERGGSKFEIGGVPLKGVKPKKYTFCTRTVYLGADFYSECAQSYIFSDSNLDCLAVDISQDLPQILGRQRLKENPWANSAYFYYRPTADYNKMNEDDFNAELERKVAKTKDLLEVFSNASDQQKEALVENYEVVAETQFYKKQYVAVTNGNPCFNDYAYVSDVRAFDIQQKDYKDRFVVYSNTVEKYSSNLLDFQAKVYFEQYESLTYAQDKLKLIYNLYFKEGSELADKVVDQLSEDDKNKTYYQIVGPERCRAHGYNVTDIKQELKLIVQDTSSMEDEIRSSFIVGSKYPRTEIKAILQDIYKRNDYIIVAKAQDLEKWYNIRAVNYMYNGKKTHGFEVLSQK